MPVAVSVTPDYQLKLDAWALCLPIHVSTAVTLLDTLGLQLGGGLIFALGQTGLVVSGSVPIEVQGYLANLQQTPGSLGLSGSTAGARPWVIYGDVFASLRFNVGPLSLTVPVMYRFTNGLSAGLVLGLAL
jgi:hypothetical protein